MASKTAVTADMNTRDRVTAFERFADKVVMRDDLPLYLGSDGDVSWTFKSTRNVAELNRDGAMLDLDGADCSDRIVLVERFNQKPGINADIAIAFNLDWEVLGTSTVSTDVAFAAGGGITLSTHGAANDANILTPHLDTAQTTWAGTKWNTSQSPRIEFYYLSPADATSVACIIWLGLKLTNTDVGATDNDQVYFRYERGVSSGKWVVWSSNNGTDETTVSDVTVGDSTFYHLSIVVDSSRVPSFYINGAKVATAGAALKSGALLIPYVGLKDTGAGAARAHDVKWIKGSRLAA